MSNLSYTVETNGQNGVSITYRLLDYVPQDVVWDASNTFSEFDNLPDAEAYGSPEYVRRMENDEYAYYRRVVLMPSKSATFSLYILSDNTPIEYAYDSYSSFLTLFKQGDALLVTSRTNVSGDDLNGVISIVSNLTGETLPVPVVQEYDPIRLRLLSYEYENMDGDGSGDINGVSFEHTFHWLTQKTSPDKETLDVDVWVSGPRNGFIIRDVSEYAYVGELDETYVYSTNSNSYYQTVQSCDGGNMLMVSEDVIFDTQYQGVFKKVKYNNDLKIVRDGNSVKITNYGRCFLQDDAYYVITLANVDDLKETASIVIKYEEIGSLPPSFPSLTHIVASFEQGSAVFAGTDNINTLKLYLTVVAYYSDGTHRVLPSDEYTLTGTLVAPSATITANYMGKTDTFTVTVLYDSRVEYLESSGTQYIDTGLNYNHGAVNIYIRTNTQPNNITSNAPIAGVGSSAGQWFGQVTSNQVYGCGSSASNSNVSTSNIVLANLLFGNGITLSLDGNPVGSRGSGTTTRSFYIFKAATTQSVTPPARIYYMRMEDVNDSVVMHLIPVRCGTTGYMYDTVSGQLFGNSGTGDFIIGNDV